MVGRHLDGLGEVVPQVLRLVRHGHRRAAEHVARTHQQGVTPEALGDRDEVRVGDVRGARPRGLRDGELVEQRAELLAVLRAVDVVGGGAEHLHPGAVELEREVVGHLPPHAHHHAQRALALPDVEHRLEADLVEEQLVAHVVVGADGLGVVVQKDGLVAHLLQRAHGVDAAPVELHRAPDAVRAAAEHQHLLAPRRGDVVGVAVVREVEVVGLRGVLRGEGVDLADPRLDAVALAQGANRVLGLAHHRADALVGVSQALGARERRGVEGRLGAQELAAKGHDLGDLVEEPVVDAGERVHLVDGHAAVEGLGEGEHAPGRGVLELGGEVVELAGLGVESVDADLQHSQGLLDDLGERAPDGHDLAHRLHLRADAVVDLAELLQVPPRELADDVVEGGLKERAGAARDGVRQVGQGVAQGDLGGDVGQGIPRG